MGGRVIPSSKQRVPVAPQNGPRSNKKTLKKKEEEILDASLKFHSKLGKQHHIVDSYETIHIELSCSLSQSLSVNEPFLQITDF